jgi:hypothetical protein
MSLTGFDVPSVVVMYVRRKDDTYTSTRIGESGGSRGKNMGLL